MNSNEPNTLTRDVKASVVPIGTKVTLQKGEQAYITQSLGGTYTVIVNGNMFRIEAKDADALGLEVGRQAASTGTPGPVTQEQLEKEVWEPLQDLLRPGNSGQHRGPRPDLRLPPRRPSARKQFQGRREDDFDRARLRHGAGARAGRAEQTALPRDRLTRRTWNWSGTRRGTRA